VKSSFDGVKTSIGEVKTKVTAVEESASGMTELGKKLETTVSTMQEAL